MKSTARAAVAVPPPLRPDGPCVVAARAAPRIIRERAEKMLQRSDAARAAARAAAAKWASIVLVSQVSPGARQQLIDCGLCDELAALPSPDLLPLLQEMIEARTLAQHPDVVTTRPLACESREFQPDRLPSSLPMSPRAHDAVLLVVARYREEVSWLARLPPGVSYHIMQKDALQPELAANQQTLLPNVGREAHSYLSFVQRTYAEEACDLKALPPLLVFAQADPFDHNPNFLSELASIASLAVDGRPLPLWLPLGLWQGNERIIFCDASGAPHQSKLLPIARTWRALFPGRCVPHWFGFTPGACFAVAREALIRRLPRDLVETALSDACALCGSVDPIAGHVFERLWMYLFLDDCELGQCPWASACAQGIVREAPET